LVTYSEFQGAKSRSARPNDLTEPIKLVKAPTSVIQQAGDTGNIYIISLPTQIIHKSQSQASPYKSGIEQALLNYLAIL